MPDREDTYPVTSISAVGWPVPFLATFRANPKVPDVTPEHLDQVYLPNSTTYIDDIILTHYSHLDGAIKNEKNSF